MKATLTPGDSFAGYRIEGLVGRGGMGVVYEAADLALERSVALKLMAPELAEDEGFRARFLTESRIAASLDHPHVVPIHAAGDHDGRLYLAMRLVEGTDLKSLLQREGTLSPERAVDLLEQIAGALDQAHRRGLVHRDVKPANVLLDEEGHAYLTDFGLTRQAGGDPGATGRVQGTLDYLAPEQIRGEGVEGRSDSYALACVLYECLAGAPPSRRATEQETLWAHLHDPPGPVPGYPGLDRILETALAKEPEDRYPTCSALMAAASGALGLEAPVERRRRRAGRLLVAAGLAGLGAVVAAALLLGAEDPSPAGAVNRVTPDSVVVVDPRSNRISDQVRIPGRPSLLAADRRSVWVVSDGNGALARLDGRSLSVTQVVAAGVTPSEIAALGSSVWLMDSRRHDLVRIDATYGVVADRFPLQGSPIRSRPGIDVSPGAVWASDGGDRVVARDPRDGTLQKAIDVGRPVDRLAVGAGAIWAIAAGSAQVLEIDRRTERARAIPVGGGRSGSGPTPIDLAVGARGVWVLNGNSPSVTRIDPGRSVVTRTIPLGVGSNPVDIATGAGSVWVALAGENAVARIDPARGRVRRIPVGGTPTGIAVTEGRVYVSVQPGFRAQLTERAAPLEMDGAVDESICTPVEYRGSGAPDLLVVSDFPLQVPRSSQQPLQLTDAIRLVLSRRDFKAGAFRVGYQSCDDSSIATGEATANPWSPGTCRRNARAYVRAEAVSGVIGPYHSGCAAFLLPILNRARGGPLAMISATATAVGLTSSGPGAFPGEPNVHYPTGERSFARVVAPDNVQGAAAAMMARRLGVEELFVLTDGESYGVGVAETTRRAARTLGIEIAGRDRWGADPGSYQALARRVRRSGADAVFLGGYEFTGGADLLRVLRAVLGPDLPILAPDGFSEFRAVIEQAGSAAEGLLVTLATAPPSRLPPAGRRFADAFRVAIGGPPDPYSATTAQATEVLLDAIAASDGTRASVTGKLLAAEIEDGILGSFRFDSNGDMTEPAVTVYEIEGGKERVRTVLVPPVRLVAPPR